MRQGHKYPLSHLRAPGGRGGAKRCCRLCQGLTHIPKIRFFCYYIAFFQGMSFYNADSGFTARIVEWIELVGLLGADKVFAYDLNMNDDLRNVMEYYQETGVHKAQIRLA